MTFDARAIKALQAGEHITSEEHPGLRIEVSATRRSWIYRYRSSIDGRLRQIKIGGWPAISLHAAIVEWERLRNLRDAGGDPALERKERRAAEKAAAQVEKVPKSQCRIYTVADVANDYWEGHVAMNRKPKGATEIRRMFDKMLGDVGRLPAAGLSRTQAFDLIKSHADRPVVAGYLRSELGAAWDYAIDAGRLPDDCPNWWRLILRGKLKSKGKKQGGESVGTVKRVLSADEAGDLIRWLPNFTRLVEDALTLYLWTATRGGEILTMEGKDVRQEADGLWWWVIPKHKTKNAHRENAQDHRVPLFGRALSVVTRRRQQYGNDLLFPARRRDGKIVPVEQKTIGAAVWMAQPYSGTRSDHPRPRLPVTHWAPHDLRRTSRTFLAALGCPTEVAESIIGHMLPGVLGVYNQHQYDAERGEWLKRLADYLEDLATVK